MKKIIIKIAAAALLIGGLVFNFALNNKTKSISFNLIEMAKACTLISGGEAGGTSYWCNCSSNMQCVNIGGTIYQGRLEAH